MREIKFRAWDEQKKVMHYDFEFIRSGINGNDWIIFKSDKQKLEDGKVFGNPYFSMQLKTMQYTGLKDKHGTEIFEGDIIQSVHACGYPTEWKSNTVVKFENGAFYPFRYPPQEVYEVIGNIYENPELLKV